MPPLVANIREGVTAWRATDYAGASATSRALLNWWFKTDHLIEHADGTLSQFRYYFAQREAVETVIWLHDVRGARDKFDLLRFDASGAVSANMFDEDWPRYVVKMATGAGKTKVLSLLIAWSYFHKLYEPDSDLARNFLLIAPNIIVLDRLRADFDGLRIFFNDPILPDNGHDGRNWRDDFQITLHIQDDVRVVRPTGNLFLTNIHRVYLGETRDPSLEDDDLRDYFLSPFGPKPAGKTTDSKTDLGEIVREIDELAVFNDEAHHIHDPRMAWFKSIQDIHHRMLQKDLRLALQVDVTATPRHDNGAIFVQTVCDYPLVEAIAQNVVKHPVLPDAASRAKLSEQPSALFTEKYDDYLQLGIEEWRKSYAEHEKLGKKAVLFVMVDDTRNCDEVGAYLEKICPELQGAVLVIHTKNNGEISEAASGKNKEELERLRKESNEIDTWKSPYKAIVSVLMLKEGWDVRNVTVIVGLRAYAAKSNILPEQTLGRGLRRMYFGSDERETVSVMGTPAFMEFVESIQSEGVTFEHVPWAGGGTRTQGIAHRRGGHRGRRQGPRRAGHRAAQTQRPLQSRVQGPGRAGPRVVRQSGTAAQAVHAGGDPRDRLQDDARRRGRSHHPARRHRPGGLPLRRRVLRPAAAEGPAPGRRLRRALSEGQDVHARHLFDRAGRSGRPGDPAQPVRAGSRQDAVRPFSHGDQRADDPGSRQLAHRGPHPAARHAPFPHRAARLRPAKSRCSTRSSARRTPAASNWRSPRSWNARPTCRPSARTTWRWASRSIT